MVRVVLIVALRVALLEVVAHLVCRSVGGVVVGHVGHIVHASLSVVHVVVHTCVVPHGWRHVLDVGHVVSTHTTALIEA